MMRSLVGRGFTVLAAVLILSSGSSEISAKAKRSKPPATDQAQAIRALLAEFENSPINIPKFCEDGKIQALMDKNHAQGMTHLRSARREANKRTPNWSRVLDLLEKRIISSRETIALVTACRALKQRIDI